MLQGLEGLGLSFQHISKTQKKGLEEDEALAVHAEGEAGPAFVREPKISMSMVPMSSFQKLMVLIRAHNESEAGKEVDGLGIFEKIRTRPPTLLKGGSVATAAAPSQGHKARRSAAPIWRHPRR